MKRKIANPDMQQKKRQQVIKKEQDKCFQQEIRNERTVYPKKISQKHFRMGHK